MSPRPPAAEVQDSSTPDALAEHRDLPMGEPKAAARALARHRRSEIRNSPGATTSGLLRISARLIGDRREDGPLGIAAYSSYGTEPSTDSLIAALLGLGHRVLLPRIAGSDPQDRRLEWVGIRPDTEYPGTHYTVNERGIREPQGPDAGLAGVHIVLVPALAVTVAGDRLGQGGGFYDRALAQVPRFADRGPLLVAVVYAHEVLEVPTWPVEPHDIRMDAILTVD